MWRYLSLNTTRLRIKGKKIVKKYELTSEIEIAHMLENSTLIIFISIVFLVVFIICWNKFSWYNSFAITFLKSLCFSIAGIVIMLAIFESDIEQYKTKYNDYIKIKTLYENIVNDNSLDDFEKILILKDINIEEENKRLCGLKNNVNKFIEFWLPNDLKSAINDTEPINIKEDK